MNKIQKLSCFFKYIFWIILIGWPIFLAMVWFSDQRGLLSTVGITIKQFIPNGDIPILVSPSVLTRMEGYLASFFLNGILNMIIAYYFIRLFTCFAEGKVFTSISINYIKKIGIVMFIWAAINPVYQMLISYVLTMHNPAGYREIVLGVDFDYLRNLIVAGLIFLIAYIMREALKLQEDQQLTI